MIEVKVEVKVRFKFRVDQCLCLECQAAVRHSLRQPCRILHSPISRYITYSGIGSIGRSIVITICECNNISRDISREHVASACAAHRTQNLSAEHFSL